MPFFPEATEKRGSRHCPHLNSLKNYLYVLPLTSKMRRSHTVLGLLQLGLFCCTSAVYTGRTLDRNYIDRSGPVFLYLSLLPCDCYVLVVVSPTVHLSDSLTDNLFILKIYIFEISQMFHSIASSKRLPYLIIFGLKKF
jgi:hypothetical protein